MEAYRARWLLPVAGRPIEHGALTVERGRIVGIGEAHAPADAAGRDLGDCILLPGLVNAHTHLELTCYQGRVPPGPLWAWFERLIQLRLRPGAGEDELAAVRTGAAASLAAGVTCVADISRMGVQVEALRSSPIRKVCFLELISGAHAPPHDVGSLTEMLDRATPLAEPERLLVGISPHTLYTVTWDDLVGTGALAAQRGVPVTIHLLETAEEAEWLPAGTGPLQDYLARYSLPTAAGGMRGRAIDLLRRAGLLRNGLLLAHVNYLDDPSFRELAASPASVVWCPRAHAFFGHRRHRWRDMLAAGVNVCVGTDSLASNETLSILDELRWLRRAAPDVSPSTLLEMGTIRGARALGLDRCFGSLEIGKCADFVMVPWDPTGPKDPVLNLLDGSRSVGRVWVGGVEMTQTV